MKSISSIQLRQSVRKVISILKKNNEPLLLSQGKVPAAVIISLEDYKAKFHDKVLADKRRQIIADIKSIAKSKTKSKSVEQISTDEILRNFRQGKE